MLILTSLLLYFSLLFLISARTARTTATYRGAFFHGPRGGAAWGMVAVGMVGASISGVTFVSVPAWAASTGMTYLQMCAGFAVGYFLVAFGLLPVYYRQGSASIYAVLERRVGASARKVAAVFFVVSKLAGAAVRLYAVCLVIVALLPFGVKGASCTESSAMVFLLTSAVVVALIWAYTRRGGVAVLVRTDVVQTLTLLVAAGVLAVCAARALGITGSGAWRLITQSPMAHVWEWDLRSPMAAPKLWLSGALVVVAMTGLDQDMMQKNLACRSLREAQKNMCVYGLLFLPVNALFLALGILLYGVVAHLGMEAPTQADALLPFLVQSGALGTWAVVPFAIGITAAAFSSADSALTALTTTVCVDLLRKSENMQARRRVHLLMAVFLWGAMGMLWAWGTNSAIDLVYRLCSYTYGPLLGLFAFAFWGKGSDGGGHTKPTATALALACFAAPLLCGVLDAGMPVWCGYRWGYELLVVNGALTFMLIFALRRRPSA